MTGKLCAQDSTTTGKIYTSEQSKGWSYWHSQRTKKVKETKYWRGEAVWDLWVQGPTEQTAWERLKRTRAGSEEALMTSWQQGNKPLFHWYLDYNGNFDQDRLLVSLSHTFSAWRKHWLQKDLKLFIPSPTSSVEISSRFNRDNDGDNMQKGGSNTLSKNLAIRIMVTTSASN